MNLTLMHEGNEVREFYSHLLCPVLVGIEATGSMHWFLNLTEELGIECRVGHPATKATCREPFCWAIWLPSKELLDLRALLLHRAAT